MILDKLIESGFVPDPLLRFGIHSVIKERLRDEQLAYKNNQFSKRIKELGQGPMAEQTQAANEQHYEVPAKFYQLVLGDRLKYSCSYFENPNDDLSVAEEKMLQLYLERGEFKDGQDILELGCGWGSITLFLAESLPQSKITAVSNSSSQREFILSRAKERGITNIEIITCDINDFDIEKTFDRVISIEMFEQLRNYKAVLDNIATWLNPDGKLFVHIFNHHKYLYYYEPQGASDWMSRYFFTGGIMPSFDIFHHFKDSMALEKEWQVAGTHYELTSEAWLKRMDANKEEIMNLFSDVYGKDAKKWWNYWRVFFMSCATLFGHNHGSEWQVGHYLLSKKSLQ